MADTQSRLISCIERANRELGRLEVFIGVCHDALHTHSFGIDDRALLESIEKVYGKAFSTNEERQAHLARRDAVTQFAAEEKESGFPYIFGLAVVKLWSILETCVAELISGALRTPERCKSQNILQKLEGPLLEFRSVDPDQQADFLADILRSSVRAPLKVGIGQFEATLDPCGLGGAVDNDVSRTLLEISQVRNIIVHKSGRIDRRFTELCPWLRCTIGTEFVITEQDFHAYVSAALWYLLELQRRATLFEGLPESSEIARFLSDAARELNRIFDARLTARAQA